MDGERFENAVAFDVTSEYGALEAVLVHEPGEEIDRLTISNRERLLFEDIPFLKPMVGEHSRFCQILEDNGVRVLRLGVLLKELLRRPEVRRRLVLRASENSGNPDLGDLVLEHYHDDPERIYEILFFGITAAELYDETDYALHPIDRGADHFLIEPLPNAYFTRDPAAVINSSIVSSNMHFPARVRESHIMHEIFSHHPLFGSPPILYGGDRGPGRPFCIEGGDIIVLNSSAIAVGRSQRTRSLSIARLAERLFEAGQISRVYEINIPAKREYMHLDTVFTVIDQGKVVAYPGVMDHVTEIVRYRPVRIAEEIIKALPVEDNRPFTAILEDEFGTSLEVIHTAGGKRGYADREQLADATNVFALGPSRVITYDRGVHTNKALDEAGIEVIAIAGSELVRGLGGPRCMTLPLQRRSKPT